MSNKLLDTLKEKFDIIYVLSLVNRNDRREMMERQLMLWDCQDQTRHHSSAIIMRHHSLLII